MARNRLWAKTLGPLELQWRFAAGRCAEQVQCRSSPGVVMMIDAVFDHFLLLCAGLLPSQLWGGRSQGRLLVRIAMCRSPFSFRLLRADSKDVCIHWDIHRVYNI